MTFFQPIFVHVAPSFGALRFPRPLMLIFIRQLLGCFLCCFMLITASSAKDFKTDVVGIHEGHLSVDFWLHKLTQSVNVKKNKQSHGDSVTPLMTTAQINSFNQQLIEENPYISSPLSMPNFLTNLELNAKINEISTIPSAPRFYAMGTQVNESDYARYLANTNQKVVQEKNKILFGLIVKRTGLRRFPTYDKVYKEISDEFSAQPSSSNSLTSLDEKHLHGHKKAHVKKHINNHVEKDLDMFQESALFPGDAVAVIHTSQDEQWYLVQAYNYLAWLPKVDVAIGDKADIAAFKKSKDFLVVTGNKVFTQYVPHHAFNPVKESSQLTSHSFSNNQLSNHPISNHPLSNIQLDMGIRLPLAKYSDYGDSLYGQNPYTSHVVKLPIRNTEGKLQFANVGIARSQDVSIGYLPFTSDALIKQSFKFLGERYGWGHDYNGRDCTGFVDEVYKSFGFIMPRNSGQQAKSDYGQNHFFDKNASTVEKLAIIATLQIGDLIYIPGHVMMYLGQDQGQPYIIHDVKGLSYENEVGELYQGTLNGVSVTPLLPLKDYVNKITNIKRLSNDVN